MQRQCLSRPKPTVSVSPSPSHPPPRHPQAQEERSAQAAPSWTSWLLGGSKMQARASPKSWWSRDVHAWSVQCAPTTLRWRGIVRQGGAGPGFPLESTLLASRLSIVYRRRGVQAPTKESALVQVRNYTWQDTTNASWILEYVQCSELTEPSPSKKAHSTLCLNT